MELIEAMRITVHHHNNLIFILPKAYKQFQFGRVMIDSRYRVMIDMYDSNWFK
jgi:hypothetical protein